NPAEDSAWAGAVSRAQAVGRKHAELAAVIAAQQQRRQAPAAAVAAGTRLADPRTVAVVTGQQAGLFGGPLFTLLKAITALKLADQVARDHQVPAVAIFWIDAEDHDWEEVRSCTVFDRDLAPRTVSLPSRPGSDPVPVSTVRLDDAAITRTLDELDAVLPISEFRDDLIASLRRAYTPGIGMTEAFGRW